MNPLIQFRKSIALSRIVLLLACFALPHRARAVSPAPDGGYPGGNTAEGQAALLSLTTGGFNTAVGYLSLRSDTTNSFNTAIGAGALLANTADLNTATGAGALLSNTTGIANTVNGAFALFSNTTGTANTAVGHSALLSNTTAGGNTAVGESALFSNTTAIDNTATGAAALALNTTGIQNTATGRFALFDNIAGNGNTAMGYQALSQNTAFANTAVGSQALDSNTTGANNTASGFQALQGNTTGSGNIAFGVSAGVNVTTANNVICIGNVGDNVDNACFIGQIFGATSFAGTPVFINSVGRLGTMTSSRRFKNDIKAMEQTSEALFALKPVTFHYKKEIDPAGTSQFGLVAEEVEKVNPDLVVRDKEGKPYSVRYEQVNAMLLNEFLKEHRKVQELEATIAKQQKDFQAIARHQEKQIEALTTGLQKVTAEVEMNQTAPQMVLNNQ